MASFVFGELGRFREPTQVMNRIHGIALLAEAQNRNRGTALLPSFQCRRSRGLRNDGEEPHASS
ncbi:protein of unknown function [Denitratisoma oestradiolicum]|uniref:Uncharacterized protein n=1 Tax=Denitratisoma oestradiolicum TaxID=311182 RepID=A0A6S6XZF9_9PROT|nr:protein of unknown function [Denitratisoma oestradiolicum]